MGLSRRSVLRAGYGAVILLLLFAAVEAYRIQATLSEHHIDAYRAYVRRDASLSELRRAIWQAGNAVRDFFIDTRPETAAVLERRLVELKADSDKALAELEAQTHGAVKPELRTAIADFWTMVQPLASTMMHASDAEHYAFVQQEVSPRRNALHTALRELTETDQAALQRGEAEFYETRRLASQRLILVLGMCVVLSLAVARFSLAHAESLEHAALRQYDAVTQAKSDLEELSARLVDIEEEGRRRLARELHDEIGQSLAVLQIEITNANALPDSRLPAIRERLLRARALTERTVQTVRDISLLLRPALLDDLGLIPALQWLLEDFMRRSGIQCEMVEHNVDEHLPDAVNTCVYRIVQEAIHNSEKHADARKVRVALQQAAGVLTIEIEDDGKGFVPGQPQTARRGSGLGLIGMRERATRMGGTLEIDSEPGRGTRLRLVVPLPESPDKPAPAASSKDWVGI